MGSEFMDIIAYALTELEIEIKGPYLYYLNDVDIDICHEGKTIVIREIIHGVKIWIVCDDATRKIITVGDIVDPSYDPAPTLSAIIEYVKSLMKSCYY